MNKSIPAKILLMPSRETISIRYCLMGGCVCFAIATSSLSLLHWQFSTSDLSSSAERSELLGVKHCLL